MTVPRPLSMWRIMFSPDPDTGLDPISFQWIAPRALAVNLAFGTTVSWIASKVPGPAASRQ